MPSRRGERLDSKRLAELADLVRKALDELGLVQLEPDARPRLAGQRHPRTNEMLRVYAAGLRQFPDIAAATGHEADAVERLAQADLMLGGLIRGLEVNFEQADLGYLECVEQAQQILDEAQRLPDELRQSGAQKEDLNTLLFNLSLLVQSLKDAQERAAAAHKSPELAQAETAQKEQRSDAEVKGLVQRFLQSIVAEQAPAAAAAIPKGKEPPGDGAHADKVRRRSP